MQDGGVGVGHLDTETKSLGVFHSEVQVVGPVGVAPNADVLFVDHVEFHRAEHGVGANGHAVVTASKEGQFEFCFISRDEDRGVVVVVLDVAFQEGEAVLFGEVAALRVGLCSEEGHQGEQESGLLHVDGLYAHFTSWLRAVVTASVIWAKTSSLAV